MGFDLPELKKRLEAANLSARMERAAARARGMVAGGDADDPYHLRAFIDDLRVAMALMTRVPMPHPEGAVPPHLARAQRVFPLVGVLVGLVVGLLNWLLADFGITPLAAAVLAIAGGAVLTGALHEDGLGDVADGFGGGHDRDSKLTIMRDSRLGTYGSLAVVAAFLAKAAALQDMAPDTALMGLVAAHALGRAVIPVLAARMPHARHDGLGQGAGRPETADVAIAIVSAAVIVLLCLPFGTALLAFALAVLGAGAIALLARRQIGGVTGDVFGAAEQVVEIAVLLAVARAFA
jgi:adenosylcobinamide-GDP ribazoletransferase